MIGVSSKKWNSKQVAEIKNMKKTMTSKKIAENKGLRIDQVNYALYCYADKEESVITSMAEVRKRSDERNNTTEKAKSTEETWESIQESWAKQTDLEKPKKKPFWDWLFG